MKNITVSVDDDTYRRARVRAAEQDTSVSALVREFLQQVAAGESEAESLKQKLAAAEKKLEPISAKLGISDGFYTEVLEGLGEGDTVVKGVTMPGAAPVLAGQQGMNNPFQSSGRGGPGGSSSGGMRGGR